MLNSTRIASVTASAGMHSDGASADEESEVSASEDAADDVVDVDGDVIAEFARITSWNRGVTWKLTTSTSIFHVILLLGRSVTRGREDDDAEEDVDGDVDGDVVVGVGVGVGVGVREARDNAVGSDSCRATSETLSR